MSGTLHSGCRHVGHPRVKMHGTVQWGNHATARGETVRWNTRHDNRERNALLVGNGKPFTMKNNNQHRFMN